MFQAADKVLSNSQEQELAGVYRQEMDTQRKH